MLIKKMLYGVSLLILSTVALANGCDDLVVTFTNNTQRAVVVQTAVGVTWWYHKVLTLHHMLIFKKLEENATRSDPGTSVVLPKVINNGAWVKTFMALKVESAYMDGDRIGDKNTIVRLSKMPTDGSIFHYNDDSYYFSRCGYSYDDVIAGIDAKFAAPLFVSAGSEDGGVYGLNGIITKDYNRSDNPRLHYEGNIFVYFPEKNDDERRVDERDGIISYQLSYQNVDIGSCGLNKPGTVDVILSEVKN